MDLERKQHFSLLLSYNAVKGLKPTQKLIS